MMASDVYFTDMRARSGMGMLDKVEKLFDRAGLGDIVSPGDLVAVKIHFGERGNTAYVRPQYVRRLVDRLKSRGGKPFLTDANTLYVGSRANAVDHLRTAVENGFAYAVVEAPLVIADGLNGKDFVSVPINLKHFREVKIGSAVYHADALLAVTHFKGHEATGFGGTLKNVGMGSGSRSGKQMMHSDILPEVAAGKCKACGRCAKWCPAGAITVAGGRAVIDRDQCLGCGECTVTCSARAIAINWKTTPDVIQEKIAEYSLGVLKAKKGKAGFISFLTNITPECDCPGWSDAPLVGDIGVLASLDPVALDQACVDLVNNQAGLKGTRLGDRVDAPDKFRVVYPNIDWSVQLEYGEAIGLGTRKYNLIPIQT
jgi:uncharacterized Fe-S center protein